MALERRTARGRRTTSRANHLECKNKFNCERISCQFLDSDRRVCHSDFVAGPERAYRGVDAETRKAERRSRFLEATLDQVAESGLSGLTMTLVCRRAGLTERYFYESFEDRDALVVAAFEQIVADLDQAVLVSVGGTGPGIAAKTTAIAQAIVSVLMNDPRKARLFTDAAASEILRERRAEVVRDCAEHLARKIRTIHRVESARDRSRLRVATRMIVGGVAEAIAGSLDGSLREPRESFVEEATLLCVALASSFARS